MPRPVTRLAIALALTLPVAAISSACAGPELETSSDELNYRSTAGQEYSLSTSLGFEVPADIQAMPGEDKTKALAAKVQGLRDAFAAAVTAELDKLWPEDERTSGAGVAIELRQASAAASELKTVDATHMSVDLSAEFSGVKNLLQKLPMRTDKDKGESFLPITADLGTGSQELHVAVTPIARSLNAYPRYLEMFEGGLDIAVHMGGDHDEPPQDIDHARSVYDDLLASGFRSPVARFEDLKLDSGPLTGSMKVKGADLPVRVRIVHVDMSTPDTRNVLIDAYKASVKDADVVIYDGHAGRQLDYSGVVVAYKPARVALPASEFKNIDASDRQQVFLFNGCETYTGYADKLYENPHKNPANTDVITTGNFSAIQAKATQVIAFVHALIDQKSGAWVPRSWDSILSRMNAVGERSWVHVYGVHGLDDNPKVSPLADVSKVGAACRSDAECGGADSRCMQVSSTKKVCGAACADTVGCPEGTKCVLPRGRTSVDDLQCAAN